MPSFNLLDEGWIPCLRSSHAPPEYLSIREVFRQAPMLRQIVDPAPTVTASIHRLLLAILHRSLQGPRSPTEWGTTWRHGSWDVARIEAYLARWHDRFDLFTEDHPFYQTTGLADTAFKDINQLTHERASNRNLRQLLFDHSLPGMGISPAAAARYLLAQQNFSVGGMFGLNPGEGQREKFAPASPLLTSAVCLVAGKNVFESLMLNWHQYDREAELPFAFSGEDRPAWERDDPVRVRERLPEGWVDLLTWQCRRIALRPTVGADGELRVTHVALMQGYRLPEAFEVATSETMVAYAKYTKAQHDVSPWLPIGLTEGRATWRDSHALFQSVASERQRPRTLDWLQRLIAGGYLESRTVFPLDIYGLLADQAKIDDWRHETLPLPSAFVQSPEMVEPLRRALDLAEQVAQLLVPRILNLPLKPRPVRGPSPLRMLGEELLRYTSERTPDGRAASQLGNHLSPEAGYWAALEGPFRTFITRLPSDFTVDRFGDVSERGDAAREWGRTVVRVARGCFDDTLRGMTTSARSLRAIAKAEARFIRTLHDIVAAYEAKVPDSQAAG
jgi:CRISPR system Cascade subunit CasA